MNQTQTPLSIPLFPNHRRPAGERPTVKVRNTSNSNEYRFSNDECNAYVDRIMAAGYVPVDGYNMDEYGHETIFANEAGHHVGVTFCPIEYEV